MWKYDGLTYPEVGMDMLKHKTLGNILRMELKLRQASENYLFLDALGKVETKKLYGLFIDPDAKTSVNISGAMRKPMVLAAELGDFSSPIWTKSLKIVKAEVLRMLSGNVSNEELLKNRNFMAYHKSRKWQNKGSLIRQYKLSKETKITAHMLKLDLTDATYEAIGEAALALQYEPKAALKPITILVKSSKKKHNAASIKSAIQKNFSKVGPSD